MIWLNLIDLIESLRLISQITQHLLTQNVRVAKIYMLLIYILLMSAKMFFSIIS